MPPDNPSDGPWNKENFTALLEGKHGVEAIWRSLIVFQLFYGHVQPDSYAREIDRVLGPLVDLLDNNKSMSLPETADAYYGILLHINVFVALANKGLYRTHAKDVISKYNIDTERMQHVSEAWTGKINEAREINPVARILTAP